MVSAQQLKDFYENSEIWKAIKDELDLWIDDIHMANEDPDLNIVETSALRGSISALRKVRRAPLIMSENLEQYEEGDDDGRK